MLVQVLDVKRIASNNGTSRLRACVVSPRARASEGLRTRFVACGRAALPNGVTAPPAVAFALSCRAWRGQSARARVFWRGLSAGDEPAVAPRRLEPRKRTNLGAGDGGPCCVRGPDMSPAVQHLPLIATV